MKMPWADGNKIHFNPLRPTFNHHRPLWSIKFRALSRFVFAPYPSRVLSRVLLALILFAAPAPAQTAPGAPNGDIRVSVVLNADGSRTTYETDSANHRSTATTNGTDGKLRERIRYQLDDAGRFASGKVFGPKEQFRFRTSYQYDANGHLSEERRAAKDGSSLGRLVFQYDAAGHQSGYEVYDGNGKLLGQTSAAQKSPHR